MDKKKTKLPMPIPAENLPPVYNDEVQYTDIATAAYYRAQARGFEPGNDLQDWLEAEQEINPVHSENI
ncbi:MAG: DUF2934 domain-containing protein [Gammaproteobacteria bacterium]|nr:DUF2934 domain-containing protein [Gammaproteobacteria bacterium]